MIALPPNSRVWLAAGATDMRKGFDRLAAMVQTQLSEAPFSGHLFVFRGRAGLRPSFRRLTFHASTRSTVMAVSGSRYQLLKCRCSFSSVSAAVRGRLA